jgi:hypothetical protein
MMSVCLAMGSDQWMARKVTADLLSQHAGALSMDDAYAVKSGPVGLVQKLINLGDCLFDSVRVKVQFNSACTQLLLQAEQVFLNPGQSCFSRQLFVVYPGT